MGTKRWWESTVLLRKLCFAIIISLCPQSYSLFANLLAVGVVLVVALVSQVAVMPYEEQHDVAWFLSLNLIEIASLSVSCVCLAFTQYAVDDSWTLSETVDIIAASMTVFLLTSFGLL